MTALQFTSLRHQISHFVHAAREPLSRDQLRDICDMAADEKALVNALYQMSEEGQLTRHHVSAGSGSRLRYGPGKSKPGAEPRENAAGGGDPKPARSGGRKSGKSKKAKKKGRKVQRKTAKRPKPGRRVTLLLKPGVTLSRVPDGGGVNVLEGCRWAITQDGTIVLLGTGIEIPKATARALVDVARRGGTVPFAALTVFLDKLDAGRE